MEIRDINQDELEKFDKFVEKSAETGFLQSSRWGEFKTGYGWSAKRFAILEQKKIIAAAQVLIRRLPTGGSMIYVPQGPVIDWKNNKSDYYFSELIRFTAENCKSLKPVFIRIEPYVMDDGNNGKKIKTILKNAGFIRAVEDIQPKNTLVVNVDRGEDEILSAMRQKGRYNIRLSAKKGVKIADLNDKKTIQAFVDLHTVTAKRDRFHTHNHDYLMKLIEKLTHANMGKLYSAWYGNQMIAGIFVVFFGKRATYLYGGSGDEFRNLMPNHALQWRAMKEAKERGYKEYDFWGIAPDGANKHSWQGITRFKTQFGGDKINYLGAYDLPISKIKYYSFRQVERGRKALLYLSQ